MTTAFRLIVKVLTFRASPRLLIYGAQNTLARWFRRGDRRYEFERLYLEHGDFWNYATSPYEHRKYRRTLDCALQWRRASASALEVGCSVGVFSRMLADHFDEVTAIDISAEAVKEAKRHARDVGNLRFRRADIRELDGKADFDLIVCAEVLYYLPKSDIDLVVGRLDQQLSDKGIILTVSGVPEGESEENDFYFDDWNRVLAKRFACLAEEDVQDPDRPYRIAVFARSAGIEPESR